MTDFRERKAARAKHYAQNVYGWKLQTCTACSGSGRYDAKGSPPCGACNGTGKERVPPTKPDTALRTLARLSDEKGEEP